MKRFSIRAAFIGKSLSDGSTEYLSRLTGRRYNVKPSGEGFLVSSDHHSDVTVATRYGAMKLIEHDELI